jgi:hypothetical protein
MLRGLTDVWNFRDAPLPAPAPVLTREVIGAASLIEADHRASNEITSLLNESALARFFVHCRVPAVSPDVVCAVSPEFIRPVGRNLCIMVSDVKARLFHYYCHLEAILHMAPDHILVAGGSVVKALHNTDPRETDRFCRASSYDVDLWFVGQCQKMQPWLCSSAR